MNYDVDRALQPYYNIRMMLEGIPRSVWDLLLPEREERLALLESNILFFKRRAKEREQVINIQRLCGFPLRPNESLREVNIKARLAGLKKDQLRKRYNDRKSDEEASDPDAELES